MTAGNTWPKITVLGANMKAIIPLIVVYTTTFVTTYGHAYHQVGSTFAGENAVGAFVSALFWPLYWSVQIWK
jgi:hypothetical protein